VGHKEFLFVDLDIIGVGKRKELAVIDTIEFVISGDAKFLFEGRDEISSLREHFRPAINRDLH
jgi:hypothetical protein